MGKYRTGLGSHSFKGLSPPLLRLELPWGGGTHLMLPPVRARLPGWGSWAPERAGWDPEIPAGKPAAGRRDGWLTVHRPAIEAV